MGVGEMAADPADVRPALIEAFRHDGRPWSTWW